MKYWCAVLVASMGASPSASAQVFYGSGDDPEQLYGYSVDGVGDIDHDGCADFAIGAPHVLCCFSGPGEAYVDVHSGRTGARLHRFSFVCEDRAGTIVRGIGDADADGTPDVLVLLQPDGDCSSSTYAFVYSGADGAYLHSFDGAWYDSDGQAADGAGDVDGDGHADIVLGEPTGYGQAHGRARVFSGATGAVLLQVTGSAVSEQVGMNVAGVGDWNGDGKDDCAIGNQSGWTRVYSVASGQILFQSAATGELDDAADFDGDGNRDLLIGGKVVSGSDGSVILDMPGWPHVRVAGDLDCDAHVDFVAGDPAYNGHQGRAALLSGEDGQILKDLLSGTSAIDIGFSVAPVGDADGDGTSDMIIGAPAWQVGGQGEVFVVTGIASAPPLRFCMTSSNSAGPGAIMSYQGSWSVAANDLTLLSTGCPPNHFGLFYYGPKAIQVLFGNGLRCVGGPIHRLTPPTFTGTSGIAERSLDYDSPPMNSGSGAVVNGATWYFQFWYRDVPGGGTFFNLSDGLQVTFCP